MKSGESAQSQPKNFRWIDDKRIAISGFPANQQNLDWIIDNQGIKAVVTLTEKDLVASGLDTSKIIYYKHVPMIDHAVPSCSQISSAVSFIENHYESVPILVHCLGGVGRSGVVVASFLAKKNGWTAQRAIARLQEISDEYVEMRQEAAVEDFVRQITLKTK